MHACIQASGMEERASGIEETSKPRRSNAELLVYPPRLGPHPLRTRQSRPRVAKPRCTSHTLHRCTPMRAGDGKGGPTHLHLRGRVAWANADSSLRGSGEVQRGGTHAAAAGHSLLTRSVLLQCSSSYGRGDSASDREALACVRTSRAGWHGRPCARGSSSPHCGQQNRGPHSSFRTSHP